VVTAVFRSGGIVICCQFNKKDNKINLCFSLRRAFNAAGILCRLSSVLGKLDDTIGLLGVHNQ
jgi:hypothetical protein